MIAELDLGGGFLWQNKKPKTENKKRKKERKKRRHPPGQIASRESRRELPCCRPASQVIAGDCRGGNRQVVALIFLLVIIFIQFHIVAYF